MASLFDDLAIFEDEDPVRNENSTQIGDKVSLQVSRSDGLDIGYVSVTVFGLKNWDTYREPVSDG